MNMAEKAAMLGWIVELCAREEDAELLDLVYKLLATNAKTEDD